MLYTLVIIYFGAIAPAMPSPQYLEGFSDPIVCQSAGEALEANVNKSKTVHVIATCVRVK